MNEWMNEWMNEGILDFPRKNNILKHWINIQTYNRKYKYKHKKYEQLKF